jgi:two-component system NtrC family sensor kinase
MNTEKASAGSPGSAKDIKRNQNPGSHYREVFWHTLSRLILLYFVPLLFLAVFFHLQYRQIILDTEKAHLEVIAEHQANTLDLFLRERLVNLANVIDDPLFRQTRGSKAFLRGALGRLRLTSKAFSDLGTVDSSGTLLAYNGPVDFTSSVTYAKEPWFQELMPGDRQAMITDIYLGFRNEPHFTIAVRREWKGQVLVLRSALSPERIYEFLTTLEGAGEVNASVVNRGGIFQVVTPRVGTPLETSRYCPPATPSRGYVDASAASCPTDFSYAWLREVPWALVVENANPDARTGSLSWIPRNLIPITLVFFIVGVMVVLLRTRQLTRRQLAMEEHEAELTGQLVQAAKLASVGELAAGIAHEINNPLAIIAEETGLLKDMMDPEFAENDAELNLEEHLEVIYQAVFRCRDITRKLLTFVRHTEVKVESHDLHAILDDVLDGMLGNELTLANVKTVRRYSPEVLRVVTDRNQLVQVLVNLVKNAIDAMTDGGTLTVQTIHKDRHVAVSVQDTGCGMTPEQLEKVFMPFFTTKEPGKGTGLGLSVSLSIIKHFGGNMYVDSTPGQGSAFTVELPYTVAD